MPYRLQWVQPAVALKYKSSFGIHFTFYHVYEGDEFNSKKIRPHQYGYKMDCKDNGEGAFNIRELPNPNNHDIDSLEGCKQIMQEAVESTKLRGYGIVRNKPSATDDTKPCGINPEALESLRALCEALASRGAAGKADIEQFIFNHGLNCETCQGHGTLTSGNMLSLHRPCKKCKGSGLHDGTRPLTMEDVILLMTE